VERLRPGLKLGGEPSISILKDSLIAIFTIYSVS
jgi:hypothetical protein